MKRMDLPFSQVLEQEIQEWNKFSKRGPSPEPIQLSIIEFHYEP